MNQKGFTIIELMIVVALMGIMAAVAINYLLPHARRANCAEVETVVHQTMLNAVQYVAENNAAPPNNATELGVTVPSTVSSIVISGNGSSTNPVTVNGTPAGICPLGNYFVINENQTRGEWK